MSTWVGFSERSRNLVVHGDSGELPRRQHLGDSKKVPENLGHRRSGAGRLRGFSQSRSGWNAIRYFMDATSEERYEGRRLAATPTDKSYREESFGTRTGCGAALELTKKIGRSAP